MAQRLVRSERERLAPHGTIGHRDVESVQVDENRAKGEARPHSLHEFLVGALRSMVADGRLQPGQKIPELCLCAELGVSRTPLREALKVLSAERLVDLLPNRGARVANPSFEELGELFSVLGALEGLAGEQAAQRITSAELRHIKSLQEGMLTAFYEHDLPVYFKYNQRIHQAILAAANNSALRDAHSSVAGRILASRYHANLSRARWEKAVREHEAILNLLILRRPLELGQMLRAHIANKFQAIQVQRAAEEGKATETSSGATQQE